MKDDGEIKKILEDVAAGAMDVRTATERLRREAVESIGFATIDHGRADRCGYPEVIYSPGKKIEQIVAIARRIIERSGSVLITRADEETAAEVRSTFGDLGVSECSEGRTFLVGPPRKAARHGEVAIVSAGTSDIAVAEEAALVSTALGARTKTFYDVGVAGIHRLMGRIEEIRAADAVIVAAGMEGALPSVVGGLVAVPVVAVPTSVGYGASFGGLAALLGMLNSCSSNVTVVNIDDGFSAGYVAALIATGR